MSSFIERAKMRQLQGEPLKPKDLWLWCVEHYGLIGGILVLISTFFPIGVIWSYLGEIDGRDLFIPSLHDPSVLPLVIFASVIYLIATILLFGYGVFAAYEIGKTLQAGFKWKCVVDNGFAGIIAVVVSVLFVLIYVGTTFTWPVYLVVLIVYWAIAISLAMIFLGIGPSRSWWFPWIYSVTSLLLFLWVAGSSVSEHVTYLAGIKQKVSDKHYYLIATQLAPLFRDTNKWELAPEGEKFAVRGYKLFQLSEITVLCPAEVIPEVKVNQCAIVKSGDLMTMPDYFVPSIIAGSGLAMQHPALQTKR